jgi:hypothetical protein
MGETKGSPMEIGFIAGSKPQLHGNAPLSNKNNEIMRTADIAGAGASSRGLGVFANA